MNTKSKKNSKTPENKLLDLLPKPKGFKLLIAMPPEKKTSKGGIIIPDELKAREHTASIYANVLAMGDLAYGDKDKFPTGPWCQPGDWVLIKSYTGTRFRVNGQEFRLINDDSVEAIIDDPRHIERA